MLEYHTIQYMAMLSTKLVCIKQNPHFAYKVPRVERRASAKQGIICISRIIRTISRRAGDWSAPIWQPLFSFPDKAPG
nr:MAG TPA: hypothetical protein [Caudoviricetes sp.]